MAFSWSAFRPPPEVRRREWGVRQIGGCVPRPFHPESVRRPRANTVAVGADDVWPLGRSVLGAHRPPPGGRPNVRRPVVGPCFPLHLCFPCAKVWSNVHILRKTPHSMDFDTKISGEALGWPAHGRRGHYPHPEWALKARFVLFISDGEHAMGFSNGDVLNICEEN